MPEAGGAVGGVETSKSKNAASKPQASSAAGGAVEQVDWRSVQEYESRPPLTAGSYGGLVGQETQIQEYVRQHPEIKEDMNRRGEEARRLIHPEQADVPRGYYYYEYQLRSLEERYRAGLISREAYEFEKQRLLRGIKAKFGERGASTLEEAVQERVEKESDFLDWAKQQGYVDLGQAREDYLNRRRVEVVDRWLQENRDWFLSRGVDPDSLSDEEKLKLYWALQKNGPHYLGGGANNTDEAAEQALVNIYSERVYRRALEIKNQDPGLSWEDAYRRALEEVAREQEEVKRKYYEQRRGAEVMPDTHPEVVSSNPLEASSPAYYTPPDALARSMEEELVVTASLSRNFTYTQLTGDAGWVWQIPVNTREDFEARAALAVFLEEKGYDVGLNDYLREQGREALEKYGLRELFEQAWESSRSEAGRRSDAVMLLKPQLEKLRENTPQPSFQLFLSNAVETFEDIVPGLKGFLDSVGVNEFLRQVGIYNPEEVARFHAFRDTLTFLTELETGEKKPEVVKVTPFGIETNYEAALEWMRKERQVAEKYGFLREYEQYRRAYWMYWLGRVEGGLVQLAAWELAAPRLISGGKKVVDAIRSSERLNNAWAKLVSRLDDTWIGEAGGFVKEKLSGVFEKVSVKLKERLPKEYYAERIKSAKASVESRPVTEIDDVAGTVPRQHIINKINSIQTEKVRVSEWEYKVLDEILSKADNQGFMVQGAGAFEGRVLGLKSVVKTDVTDYPMLGWLDDASRAAGNFRVITYEDKLVIVRDVVGPEGKVVPEVVAEFSKEGAAYKGPINSMMEGSWWRLDVEGKAARVVQVDRSKLSVEAQVYLQRDKLPPSLLTDRGRLPPPEPKTLDFSDLGWIKEAAKQEGTQEVTKKVGNLLGSQKVKLGSNVKLGSKLTLATDVVKLEARVDLKSVSRPASVVASGARSLLAVKPQEGEKLKQPEVPDLNVKERRKFKPFRVGEKPREGLFLTDIAKVGYNYRFNWAQRQVPIIRASLRSSSAQVLRASTLQLSAQALNSEVKLEPVEVSPEPAVGGEPVVPEPILPSFFDFSPGGGNLVFRLPGAFRRWRYRNPVQDPSKVTAGVGSMWTAESLRRAEARLFKNSRRRGRKRGGDRRWRLKLF